jgi:hypothetical protein
MKPPTTTRIDKQQKRIGNFIMASAKDLAKLWERRDHALGTVRERYAASENHLLRIIPMDLHETVIAEAERLNAPQCNEIVAAVD